MPEQPGFTARQKEPRQLGADLVQALAQLLAHNTQFLDDVHGTKPLFFRGTVTALRTGGSPPMKQVQVQRTGQGQPDGYWYPIYDAGYAATVGDDVLLVYTDRRMSACVIGGRTHAVDIYDTVRPVPAGAWSGGAAIALGGGLQGGGYYGIFESQGIQGGGSVSGVSINLGSGNSPPRYWTSFGFYAKVASLPASDMALCDLDLGATGYFRAKLTSAGHVVAEGSYSGCGRSLDLTPTTALVTGTWYWVAAMLGNDQAFLALNLSGRVTKIDGTGDGAQTTGYDTTGAGSGAGTYTATLGWGVHHSASYLDLPGSSGNGLSKLQIATGANGPFMSYPSPPSADVSPSGLVALYLCRDTVGTTSGTVDATTNHYDLSPGPNGLLVVAAGPYP